MATKVYPRGKLNEADEGALELRIAVKDRTVIVGFGKPVKWIGLGATEARGLAELLLKHANAIDFADMFDSGYLQPPGDERDETTDDRRRGELGGWNEYDRLRNEREVATLRAQAAEKQLAAIAVLVSIYDNQDEPEGQVSARRALTAIGETIGQPCSICRSRHGSDVLHACE